MMSNSAESSADIQDRDADDHGDTHSHEEEAPQTKRAKVGKPARPIWSIAFDDPEAYSLRSPNNAACKHCKQSFRHHHKTLVVERHLRKCRPFMNLMLNKPVSDRLYKFLSEIAVLCKIVCHPTLYRR